MKLSLFSFGSILLPLVVSTPIVSVDIHITDDAQSSNTLEKPLPLQHVLDSSLTPPATKSEQIPGWVYIEGKSFRARIHGNTFWNVKGELDEAFPLEDFLFDPLLFTLNHPNDFDGSFNGTIGRGVIDLKWEKSGATIAGRSPIGDFAVKGSSKVDYSP